MSDYKLHESVAAIISDAGGKIVGRTRFQKVTYLLQLAGFTDEFHFEYKHYGPFSEDLAEAISLAVGVKLIEEEEQRTSWGGWYSVFSREVHQPVSEERALFVRAAINVGAVELELAATAAYLFLEEHLDRDHVWEETARRKPEKATSEKLATAKLAYRCLQSLDTPRHLPQIA